MFGEIRIEIGHDSQKIETFIKDWELNNFGNLLNDIEDGLKDVKVMDSKIARRNNFRQTNQTIDGTMTVDELFSMTNSNKSVQNQMIKLMINHFRTHAITIQKDLGDYFKNK